MHVFISYTDDLSEREIIRLVRSEEQPGEKETVTGINNPNNQVIPQQAVFDARNEISSIAIPEAMENYIVSLIAATRRPAELDKQLDQYIQVGVSPRGSIAIDKCSRAHAWLQGRDQVTPDDIRAVINDCLRHRIKLSYEAQADGLTNDDILGQLVKLVAVA